MDSKQTNPVSSHDLLASAMLRTGLATRTWSTVLQTSNSRKRVHLRGSLGCRWLKRKRCGARLALPLWPAPPHISFSLLPRRNCTDTGCIGQTISIYIWELQPGCEVAVPQTSAKSARGRGDGIIIGLHDTHVLRLQPFERHSAHKLGPERNQYCRRWGLAQEARELQQQSRQQAALEPQLAAARSLVESLQQDAQHIEAVTCDYKV